MGDEYPAHMQSGQQVLLTSRCPVWNAALQFARACAQDRDGQPGHGATPCSWLPCCGSLLSCDSLLSAGDLYQHLS